MYSLEARELDNLIECAFEIMENAYAPYSEFRVGACVLTLSGKIFCGVNVENASYGLTVCAERVAVFKAVSEGERDLVAIAVVTESDTLAFPCGACRQVLYEFSPDMIVVVANRKGKSRTFRLNELLPEGFRLE